MYDAKEANIYKIRFLGYVFPPHDGYDGYTTVIRRLHKRGWEVKCAKGGVGGGHTLGGLSV